MSIQEIKNTFDPAKPRSYFHSAPDAKNPEGIWFFVISRIPVEKIYEEDLSSIEVKIGLHCLRRQYHDDKGLPHAEYEGSSLFWVAPVHHKLFGVFGHTPNLPGGFQRIFHFGNKIEKETLWFERAGQELVYGVSPLRGRGKRESFLLRRYYPDFEKS